MNSFEIINGKKYKKCPPGKIRNPITMRCITIKTKKSKVINQLYRKINQLNDINEINEINPINEIDINEKANIIQKNMKKLLLPFINRVSANINDRIKYYNRVINKFKLKENKDYCLKFYKLDKNNNPIFRIGTNIILKKRIGSDSAYGIVYLSSFRDIDGKLFKFAIKMFPHEKFTINNNNLREINIMNLLSNLVLQQISPHFIIIYKSVICKSFEIYNKQKTTSSNFDLSLQYAKGKHEFYKYYPELFKKNISNTIYTIICEIANGDMNNLFDSYTIFNDNQFLFGNLVLQMFLSLAFFTHYTNYIHDDAHHGNFLYHKIKPGGFLHYKIYNQDYFIENLGYLILLTDFGLIKKPYDSPIINDFYRAFICIKFQKNFANNLFQLKYQTQINDLFKEISINLKKFNYKFTFSYNPFKNKDKAIKNNLIKFIQHFLKLFIKFNIIHTTLPKNSSIINSKPFII